MTHSALFYYPFEQDLIDSKYLNGPALAVNVPYDPMFDKAPYLSVVQNYKYEFGAWEAKGYKVLTEIPSDQGFQCVFCQIPQSKEYSLYLMAQSFEALEDEGVLICLAGNNENGKRLKKWFENFGVQPFSESKQKQRIVWAYKKEIKQDVIDEYLELFGKQKIELDNFQFITKPGVYGWNKIDQGSKLLIENLPNNLSGTGTDFGCGYGFLSFSVTNTDIQELDLYDSDYQAIKCAKENLKDVQCQVSFIHSDLTQEKINQKYDFILMNPPFHQGKKTNSDIGSKFIEKAAAALKSNGMLYMVANDFLPYEKTLEKNFKNVQKITEENGFKVFFAQK